MKIPIHSYEDFVKHLGDREYFGQKLGLERIQSLLARLGNPQEKFRSVHIAGTNGKGSTAAMIAAILEEAGYRTGLYTSPHLQDFCERIRVDGMPITPDEVLKQARHIREVEDEPLTFFELATAIGFLHFAEEGVDLAVVETGLGGRLDATNVIQPVLSVITTIARDHTAQLGEALEEIAFEKAGIVKPGVPVVVGLVPPEALEVIREQASKKGARFVPVVMDLIPPNIPIRLEGAHQRRNANLALATVDVLNALGEIRVNRDAVWRGFENVRWPGRLETVSAEPEGPWILLDGAHNPEAMRAVRDYLEENLEGRKLTVVLGAMADKDLRGILTEIAPLASRIIVTAPAVERAAAPAVLAEHASSFGLDAIVCRGVPEAMGRIVEEIAPEEVLLITGSFFTVGEARRWLADHSG
ncbi:MAG TPA: folylpolyglutamate synthase/dihydrofolate synthase family protein [bacterium]|nr:folylpolyglutamate synthase/dihydrofolate synthase family protein [bacterium]